MLLSWKYFCLPYECVWHLIALQLVDKAVVPGASSGPRFSAQWTNSEEEDSEFWNFFLANSFWPSHHLWFGVFTPNDHFVYVCLLFHNNLLQPPWFNGCSWTQTTHMLPRNIICAQNARTVGCVCGTHTWGVEFSYSLALRDSINLLPCSRHHTTRSTTSLCRFEDQDSFLGM